MQWPAPAERLARTLMPLRAVARLTEEATAAARFLRESGIADGLSPTGVADFIKQWHGGARGPAAAVQFHASISPTKIAIRCAGRSVRYCDLASDIRSLAVALQDYGLRPSDRIALRLGNSIEHLVAQLAVPTIGARIVEIGTSLKEAEVSYILRHSRASAVLADGDDCELIDSAAAAAGVKLGVRIACSTSASPSSWSSYVDVLGSAEPSRRLRSASSDDSGVIIYTSGTTGPPKGAERRFRGMSYRAVLDFMQAIGMRSDDIQLVTCPLYHSAAPAFVVMGLALGGTVVLMEKFDAKQALELCDTEGVTCAFMVPTQIARILEEAKTAGRGEKELSLRWLCSGASPLSNHLARAFQARFGEVLWNFYGATEIGLVSLAGPTDHATKPGTVGRPLAGGSIEIRDGQGQPAECGDIGTVYVRNGMTINGYFQDTQATAQAQRQGAFSVGDLGRVDSDGYLYLEGRSHDMIISGGVNIYPIEIESILLEHPDITDAAVIGVPDPAWGESVRAFVVVQPSSKLTEDDVIAHCRDQLADFKRPRTVIFRESLPRNATGKILKRKLRRDES